MHTRRTLVLGAAAAPLLGRAAAQSGEPLRIGWLAALTGPSAAPAAGPADSAPGEAPASTPSQPGAAAPKAGDGTAAGASFSSSARTGADARANRRSKAVRGNLMGGRAWGIAAPES